MFNMMDTYSAILCSAFMHCKLLDSLCEVGTHATGMLAKKSRDLLVNLLRISSRIFSESTVTDLLALPKLVEYSTSLGSKNFPDKARKANDLLQSLAGIFSASAFESWSKTASGNARGGTSLGHALGSTKDAEIERKGVRDRNGSSVSSYSSSSFSSFSSFNDVRRTVTDVAKDIKKMILVKDTEECSPASDFLLTKAIEIDKSGFSKLIEQSRVLSAKDGKDPLKWDWEVIEEILEYEIHTKPERLAEGPPVTHYVFTCHLSTCHSLCIHLPPTMHPIHFYDCIFLTYYMQALCHCDECQFFSYLYEQLHAVSG